jgi:hypothetical protein
MLQRLGDHIANCLGRADDAERRGLEMSNPAAKAETERMAKGWRYLARSYEFIESLERFLLDGRAVKNALPPRPPQCPMCNRDMRLFGIEPDSDTNDLFTFECTDCEHFEVMVVPAEEATSVGGFFHFGAQEPDAGDWVLDSDGRPPS